MDDYDMSEASYYGTLAGFIYWLLELGPKRIYKDANEMLDTEISMRLDEGTMTIEDVIKYVNETLSLEDYQG